LNNVVEGEWKSLMFGICEEVATNTTIGGWTGSPGKSANDVNASIIVTFILRPSPPVKDCADVFDPPFF
jgi:hypothetical protein